MGNLYESFLVILLDLLFVLTDGLSYSVFLFVLQIYDIAGADALYFLGSVDVGIEDIFVLCLLLPLLILLLFRLLFVFGVFFVLGSDLLYLF